MRSRFVLLCAIFLWLAPVKAGVMSQVVSFDPCGPNVQTFGETQAAANLSCPGVSGTASVSYLDSSGPSVAMQLDVSGTKGLNLPAVFADASFDVLFIVTGTDQPGYVSLRPQYWVNLPIIETSSHSQRTQAYVMGMLLGDTYISPLYCPSPCTFNIPFQPGVPVRVFGELWGHAGRAPGNTPAAPSTASFDSSLFVYIRVTAEPDQGTAPPLVQGAILTLVPEPSYSAIVALAIGLFALARIKSHCRTGHSTQKTPI